MENNLICFEEYQKLKDYKNNIDNINKLINNKLNDSIKNFICIGYLLSLVKEDVLNELGFNDIYDYSNFYFNLGKTSTKNFINVYKKFGHLSYDCDIPSININYVQLKDEYKEYSMSQLVELLNVSDDEIEKYSPDLTIKEIRSIKKLSQMSDFENSQLEFFNKILKDFYIDTFGYCSGLYDFNFKVPSTISFVNNSFEFSVKYKKKIKILFKFNLSNYSIINCFIECDYHDKNNYIYFTISFNSKKLDELCDGFTKSLKNAINRINKEYKEEVKEVDNKKLLFDEFTNKLNNNYWNEKTFMTEEMKSLYDIDDDFKKHVDIVNDFISTDCPFIKKFIIKKYSTYYGFELKFDLKKDFYMVFNAASYSQIPYLSFSIYNCSITLNELIYKYRNSLLSICGYKNCNYPLLSYIVNLANKYYQDIQMEKLNDVDDEDDDCEYFDDDYEDDAIHPDIVID